MSLDFSVSCAHCNRGDSFNITHNLRDMADAAGIYKCLWRPEENGFKLAKDIILLLETSVADMEQRPEYYKKFNAVNGWGMYKHFLPWVKEVLAACKQNPDAIITANR